MTNKVNFNAGGKIKVNILVSFLVLLAGTIEASAQKPNFHILGQSNGKKAEGIEIVLKNKIQGLLMDRYPCADNILTDDDAGIMLSFERERQLLGAGDPDALVTIGGALGVPYVVSVNVTQINSTFTMNVLSMDVRRAKTISRKSATVHSEAEVQEALESLTEEFVSDLLKTLPDCYENEWIGTITYNRVYQGKFINTKDHIVYKGTVTTEITSEVTKDAEFEVRGKNRPARALFVKYSENNIQKTLTDLTVTCQGPTPFERGKTVSWNTKELEITKAEAEGKADQAIVSVSIEGDRFTISFTVPPIEDVKGTRDWSWEHNGGCGDPESKHEVTPVVFTTYEEYGNADGTIDPENPDVLVGRKIIKVPSLDGIQETKTITWNLRFIRKPSSEKIK